MGAPISRAAPLLLTPVQGESRSYPFSASVAEVGPGSTTGSAAATQLPELQPRQRGPGRPAARTTVGQLREEVARTPHFEPGVQVMVCLDVAPDLRQGLSGDATDSYGWDTVPLVCPPCPDKAAGAAATAQFVKKKKDVRRGKMLPPRTPVKGAAFRASAIESARARAAADAYRRVLLETISTLEADALHSVYEETWPSDAETYDDGDIRLRMEMYVSSRRDDAEVAREQLLEHYNDRSDGRERLWATLTGESPAALLCGARRPLPPLPPLVVLNCDVRIADLLLHPTPGCAVLVPEVRDERIVIMEKLPSPSTFEHLDPSTKGCSPGMRHLDFRA